LLLLLLLSFYTSYPQVQVHLAARNPEQEKLEAEKRAEEMARLRCDKLSLPLVEVVPPETSVPAPPACVMI
jgi:hypothetical protein